MKGFQYSGGFWASVVNCDKVAYRAGWERVFGKTAKDPAPTPQQVRMTVDDAIGQVRAQMRDDDHHDEE